MQQTHEHRPGPPGASCAREPRGVRIPGPLVACLQAAEHPSRTATDLHTLRHASGSTIARCEGWNCRRSWSGRGLARKPEGRRVKSTRPSPSYVDGRGIRRPLAAGGRRCASGALREAAHRRSLPLGLAMPCGLTVNQSFGPREAGEIGYATAEGGVDTAKSVRVQGSSSKFCTRGADCVRWRGRGCS